MCLPISSTVISITLPIKSCTIHISKDNIRQSLAKVSRAIYLESMAISSDMICFALYSSTQAIQKVYRPLLDELGLTYPQYLVLTVLWDADGPTTVGALGDTLYLESNTLTPLLQRMERARLIERRRSETDERRVEIRLTDAGSVMQEKASKIPECIKTSTGLSDRKLTELTNEVRALAKTLRRASKSDSETRG